MNQEQRQAETFAIGSGPRWLNSSVTFHQGTLATIRSFVPDFERRAFAITGSGSECSRLNERLDVIVRKPFRDDPDFVPIGTVSRSYALVQHADVLDLAAQAMKGAGISPEAVRTGMKITEYGERMALSLNLPDEYSFDPGDGHRLALRLECFNSVDGSTRFLALIG